MVELDAKLSSVSRKGLWVVPRALLPRTRMGSTELDFTEARIDHAVVDIEVDLKGGSVEMRLPAEASASTDGVDVMAGSIEDHRRNAVTAGRPHFVITGSVRWVRWRFAARAGTSSTTGAPHRHPGHTSIVDIRKRRGRRESVVL